MKCSKKSTALSGKGATYIIFSHCNNCLSYSFLMCFIYVCSWTVGWRKWKRESFYVVNKLVNCHWKTLFTNRTFNWRLKNRRHLINRGHLCHIRTLTFLVTGFSFERAGSLPNDARVRSSFNKEQRGMPAIRPGLQTSCSGRRNPLGSLYFHLLPPWFS